MAVTVAASIDTLERVAMDLRGEDVSFRVHYWGGHKRHPDNRVHKHSFFEICYVIGGEGVYWEGEKEYPLQQGTLFCSRPGILHQIHKGANLFLLWVAFEPIPSASTAEGLALFDRLAVTPHFYASGAGDSPAAWIWRALMQHAEAPQPHMRELLVRLAYSLLRSLQSLFCKAEHDGVRQLFPTGSGTLLHRAKLFVKDNLAQPLTLEDVAAYLHISPRHLSRLFSIQLGVPYSSFVRQERIRAAAELLATTDRSIKHIAEETGFASVHYFTRVFTAEKGVTPGQFRRRRE